MKQNSRNLIIALGAAACLAGFSACNKEYSPDTPFPKVYTPTIYTSSNNKIVYALDPKTGERKWKLPVNGEVHATPVLFANALWVGTSAGWLYKINYEDGVFIDSSNMGGAIEGTPLPYNDLLLVPAGNTLHAIFTSTTTVHTIFDDSWSYDMGSPILSSPTVHIIPDVSDKAIFIAGTGNKVTALDVDGSQLWSFNPATPGAFYSSPCVVSDSFLYIGNDNGNMYAVNTYDGTEKWEFATQGQVRSSPISIGGNILFGSSDRNFYSVDDSTGLLRWKIQTNDIIVSSPAVYNQYVYFGSYDDYIYCVDIIDGTVKWKRPSFGLIKASPLIYKGELYLGSFDKNLYKLKADDGSEIWVKNIYGQMETSAILDTVGGAAVPSISGDYRY
jgi:outer membrane protein assembly factor BamB